MFKVMPLILAVIIAIYTSIKIVDSYSNLKEARLHQETIVNAIEVFLDNVSDTGIITETDVNILEAKIHSRSGMYKIDILVERLAYIDNTKDNKEFVIIDYFTNQSNINPLPEETVYLIKTDLVTVKVNQLEKTLWQLKEESTMSTVLPDLWWSYSKPVTSDGRIYRE